MRRLSRLAPRSTSTERLAPRCTRAYNFASSQYNAAFGDLPPVDSDKLRSRRARIHGAPMPRSGTTTPSRRASLESPSKEARAGPRTTISGGRTVLYYMVT